MSKRKTVSGILICFVVWPVVAACAKHDHYERKSERKSGRFGGA